MRCLNICRTKQFERQKFLFSIGRENGGRQGKLLKNEKMDVTYLFEIQNGVLSFQIITPLKQNTLCAFYILRNEERIHIQTYGADSHVTFQLEEEGWYSVTYFVKSGDDVRIRTSNTLGYFLQKAHVFGSEILTRYCAAMAVASVDIREKSNFSVLDPMELACRWEKRIFFRDSPDMEAVSAMRDQVNQLLGQIDKNEPIYIISWNLWQGGAQNKRLHWILEEIYHICRQPVWAKKVECLSTITDGCMEERGEEDIVPGLYQTHESELKRVLQEMADRAEYRDLDDACVEIEQKGNKLHARFRCAGVKTGDKFAFYLCRGGKRCEQTAWSGNPDAEWELAEVGIYSVQGFIKRGEKMSIRWSLGTAFFGKTMRDRLLETGKTKDERQMLTDREKQIPGKWKINYILEEKKGAEWLIVTFSAFAPTNAQIQKPYSFMDTCNGIMSHVLYLQDSLGERGTYYMVHNMDFSPAEQILGWIETVRKKLEVPKEHVILMGSSKGGSAALYFGLRGHYGHVLAMAPQIRIGSYVRGVPDTAGYMFDYTREEESVSILDQIIYQAEQENNDTVIHLYVSEHDGQFKLHTGPFIQYLNENRLPKKLDICIDNRIQSHTDHLRFNAKYTVRKLIEIICQIQLLENDEELQLHNLSLPATDTWSLKIDIERFQKEKSCCTLSALKLPYMLPLNGVKRIELEIGQGDTVYFKKQVYSCIDKLAVAQCSCEGDQVTVTIFPKKDVADDLVYALYVNKADGSRIQVFPYQKSPVFTFKGDYTVGKYILQCFWKYNGERYSIGLPLKLPDV